jgi:hypothetical protein
MFSVTHLHACHACSSAAVQLYDTTRPAQLNSNIIPTSHACIFNKQLLKKFAYDHETSEPRSVDIDFPTKQHTMIITFRRQIGILNYSSNDMVTAMAVNLMTFTYDIIICKRV